jgi:hypothetical protein
MPSSSPVVQKVCSRSCGCLASFGGSLTCRERERERFLQYEEWRRWPGLGFHESRKLCEGEKGRMLTIKRYPHPSNASPLTCSTRKILTVLGGIMRERERERELCGEGMRAMWQRGRRRGKLSPDLVDPTMYCCHHSL